MNYIEKYISAMDGKRIYTRHYGDPVKTTKAPIICLTGLVRTADDFEEFASSCASDGFYVITMDYRGRGRSDFDDNVEHYRGQTLVLDILSVLDASHVKDAIFVGTSLGGILSMVVNMVQPSRVRAVISNDIGPAVITNGLSRIKEYVSDDTPQKSWEEAVLLLKKLFPTLRLRDEEAWIKMARGTYQEGDGGLLHIRWDKNIAKILGIRKEDPDLWRVFKSLKNVPMLAIRGTLSDVLSQETFENMKRVKPDLMSVSVEGVGHCPMYDEPVVLEALLPFLKNVS